MKWMRTRRRSKRVNCFQRSQFGLEPLDGLIPREVAGHFNSEGTHLSRYSRLLNCAEINSSFYRPHKKETWQRWAKSVPDDFRFSVKAPKTISHEARLNCGSELLSAFLQQVSFLGDKLGPVLFQLPPSLEFDYRSVKKFLSLLRDNYAGGVVWEPRHSTWFDDSVNDLLREFRIARVAADPACVPAALSPGGIADLVYFRLHGSPRRYYSAYGEDFLNPLLKQLKSLASTAQLWCVFDNTASGSAIRNALDLATRVTR